MQEPSDQHEDTTSMTVKKTPNAYILFQNAVRDEVLHQLRDLGHSTANFMKKVSERWGTLTDEEKAPFKAEARRQRDEQKKRYPGVKSKYKRKNKAKNKGLVSEATSSRDIHKSGSGFQFQSTNNLQDAQVSGGQSGVEVGTPVYDQIKWEPIQVEQLHDPTTRHLEKSLKVPAEAQPEMYTVFDTNATQIPTEASSSAQNAHLLDPLDSPWIDVSQNLPHMPQLQEEVASPAGLTASPFAFSESSLSDLSTPSTALIPTPGSASFEAPLPQAETSWPMNEENPQMDLVVDFLAMPSPSTDETNVSPSLFLPFDFNDPSLFLYGDAQMQLNFNTVENEANGILASGTLIMDLPPEFYSGEWVGFPQF